MKGNGRDASPSRRFDGSGRAPSTERPIRHSVVAEKSTRAAPCGETTTSDATAVSSARARETYRRARSRPPPSRPRSLRRRTPRGAVTRRTRKTRAVVRDVGGHEKIDAPRADLPGCANLDSQNTTRESTPRHSRDELSLVAPRGDLISLRAPSPITSAPPAPSGRSWRRARRRPPRGRARGTPPR